MPNVQPLREQILIKKLDAPSTVKGIYVPPNATNPIAMGEVLAIGSGRYYSFGRVDPDVKVGDKVYYAEGSGFTITEDAVDYLLIPENSIVAKVSGGK